MNNFAVIAQQNNNLYVKNYSEKDGLSSNYVRCFLQDSKGYMWIGTSYGLNRYDGEKFEKFYADANNANSISSNIISAIIEDKNGNIWIGTESEGLNKFNATNGRFSHYKSQPNTSNSLQENFIKSLFLDKEGNIWIGTVNKGWTVFNPDANTFYHGISAHKFINRWGRNSSNNIDGFAQDDKGNMWMASGFGLQMQNYTTKKVTTYIDSNTTFHTENQNLFLTVKYYGDSLLWLGTWAGGLKSFNLNTKKFVSYLLQPTNPYSGNRNIVDEIAKKSNHELWVATLDKGLGIFNITSKQFQFFEHNPNNKNSPYPRECRSIFIDNNTTLWAAFDYGFSIAAPSHQNIIVTAIPPIQSAYFTEASVQSLYHHPANNTLYFGLDVGNGLYEKNIATQQLQLLSTKGLPTTKSNSYTIGEIYKWDENNLLVNVNREYYLYQIVNKRFTKLSFQYKNTIVNISGIGSHLNTNNELWIVNYNRDYYKIRLGSNIIQQIGGAASNKKFPFTTGSSIISGINDTSVWVFDRVNGLSILNPITNANNTNFYEKNSYKIGDPKKIITDKQNHYWFTTYNEGLFEMWQTKNGKYIYKRYTEREGLPDLFLNEIFCDSLGFIWVSSRKGIIRFHPSKPVFKNYNDESGLPETSYHIDAGHLATNQILYFGSINNFIEINTKQIIKNETPPKILFRNFNIFNKPWSDSLNINAQQKIELDYQHNFISFEFAALDFINAGQCQYAYQLQGLDKDWVYCSNRQYASYAGLKPGNYNLHIKAANSDGVWNEKGISLQIIIHSPFWQTWWFYTLVLIAIAAIIFWIYKYRVAIIRKEEKVKTAYNKKVAEIEMKALRAQMNPHFIFNCLNSINRYIVKSDHITASGYLTRFAKLIRLILDSSASETTALDNEIQLLQLYIEMELLRFDNKFTVNLEVDKSIHQSIVFIPSMLIQPYIENAIWHGLLHKQDKGNLQLLFTQLHNQILQVTIIDDGVGRQKAAEQKSKQILKEKSYGMKITGDRIKIFNELHSSKASCTIEDLLDMYGKPAGTKVVLLLPFETEFVTP